MLGCNLSLCIFIIHQIVLLVWVRNQCGNNQCRPLESFSHGGNNGWRGKGSREREIIAKRAYLSIIQRKSFEIICSMEVVSVSLFDTGINFKDPNLFSPSHFRLLNHKPIRSRVFVLNTRGGHSNEYCVCIYDNVIIIN